MKSVNKSNIVKIPTCCGGRCEPPVRFELPRRDFLRIAGMTSIALLAVRGRAFAGPFVKSDFAKLIPSDKKLDPAWVASLTARGEPETFSGRALRYIGMPVGGLFCGTLYLGGDGRLWLWDIFNKEQLGIEPAGITFKGQAMNAIWGSAYIEPLEADKYRRVGQGFEIAVKSGGREVRRALDSRAGAGFRDVTFTGEYPIGVIRYSDPEVPVAVKLEAFSPFTPLDVKDSSLPVTIFSFELTNNGKAPAEVSLEGFLENAVFQDHRYLSGVRRISTRDGEGATVVSMSAVADPLGEIKRPDIIFEDWSKNSYSESGWTVEGDAFGNGPIERAAMPAYMGDVGGETPKVANSHAGSPSTTVEGKDAATGKLTSKPFTIDRKFIRFWIGGGQDASTLGLRLVVDGKTVQSATGKNANPMEASHFDVSGLLGKEAHIEIFDEKTANWSNIGVGSIVLTDRPPLTAEQYARLPDAGTMALALMGAPAEIRLADAEAPIQDHLTGRLGRKLTLAPGQTATVNFAISWHFPHAPASILGGREHAYAARFADAPAAVGFVAQNFDRLASQTRLWRDTWYDSTLPYWFLNRTFANTSILATTTCFLFADGRFYANEGVGCCPGTCIHVWHYAQAMGRLFPELERNHREFVDFGLALKPDGTVAFRGEYGDVYAVDGQAGRVLGALREYQMSDDDAFLRRIWPGVKKATEKMIATDGDGDGIVKGPLHNTLDADWNGVVPWLCGMYQAGLAAAEVMANEVGDKEFASRCRAILDVGKKNLDDLCWNEDFGYYVHIGDPARKTEVGAYDGCHIDQVLGQSWAWQVGLGDVMTRDHARKALESLWKYNFTPDVGPFRQAMTAGRWYAMPGDGGMIMLANPFAPDIVFTGPTAGTAMYFNECMSGFEHQAASHMLWEGMLTEGLATTRAIHDRYSPNLRNPYNEIECSDHYARAMASYGTFLAACGFEYNGPKQHIGFAPRITPQDFKTPFTASKGWGTFRQKIDGGKLAAALDVKWGEVRLTSFSLQFADAKPRSVQASLAGAPVPAKISLEGTRATITFEKSLAINAGQTLALTLS